MGYSIKILKNEDYDNLPYARIRESFAVTSPDSQNIYVRYTNANDFNKMLIDHEMNHLVEEVPTDVGPDGERYFLSALLSGLGSVLGSAGSGLMSGLGGIGGLLGKAGSSLLGGIKNIFSNPASISTTAGTGVRQGVSGGLLNNLFGGLGNVASSILGGGGGGGLINNLFGGISNLLGGNTLTNPQSLLGGTMMGFGLGKGLPKVPALPQSVESLRGMVSSGGSPLGQLAQSKLTEQLGQSFNPLSEEEIQAALRQIQKEKEMALDKVNDTYKNLRPGSDYSSDTAWKKDIEDVNTAYGQLEADTLANRTRELKSIFNSQRTQQIQQALGASDTQMSQLAQIAQLDVNQIMTQLQLDYDQAMMFKNTFTSLGSNLLNTGLGGGVDIMSLFK